MFVSPTPAALCSMLAVTMLTLLAAVSGSRDILFVINVQCPERSGDI